MKDRESRRLKSENKEYSAIYTKELLKSINNQNVFARLTSLWSKVKGGNITTEQIQEYEKLDNTITESMLAAERKLHKPGLCKYTPEWIEMLSKIRYLKLLTREANGTILNNTVMENARKKANTSFKSRNHLEIVHRLKDTYRQMREYMQEYEQKRDEFMDKLLTEAQKKDEDKRAK